MKWFYEFFKLLDYKIKEPEMYGWFHILSLLIMVLLTIFLCVKYKNANNKKLKKILLIMSSIMILFEIYKQLNFSFNYDNLKVINGMHFHFNFVQHQCTLLL